ncbi:uncharacterized protein LOC125501954 [Athalia rosae]|uniref:uncharacterized protein LOC125501954 n=1 Tax=Athalia rosae TaxID=37344 RepID=UPI002033AC47|nr:uncharacterized protein LOC125501954 [Athalia rosae]
MQEIAGTRRNTVRYIYEEYEYHIDTMSPVIYRCATRKTTGCRGTARVDAAGVVTVYWPHKGHQPNRNVLEEAHMRQEMLDLAARTNAPPKEIFDKVCRRNPVVALNFSFVVIKRAIQRVRAKLRLPTSATFQDLSEVLNDYAPT